MRENNGSTRRLDRDRTLSKPTDPSLTAEGNPPSVHTRRYVRAPFPDRAGRWDRTVRHVYIPIHSISCWIFIPALFAFILATPSCFSFFRSRSWFSVMALGFPGCHALSIRMPCLTVTARKGAFAQSPGDGAAPTARVCIHGLDR
jgi:hypothetical protein